MQYRDLGRTGLRISTVSFGAWAIGGTWGPVDDAESLAALHRAVDLGVNFFDTADVYGDGRSEQLLARLKQERREPIYVATKAGRRLERQSVAGYGKENLTRWIERSLRNLRTEALDLLQLHCPPTELYYTPEVFGILDDFVNEGRIRAYGVSVERVEEALKAIEYPNVQSVQIIFNLFRQRPAELFFKEAERRGVGVLARLPLASGLLAGKLARDTSFTTDDHRAFNRHGEAFDRGETFSGIDYELGLELVDELRKLVPGGVPMSAWALRWVLMNPAVTCVIPGAKRTAQVEENVRASELGAIPPADLAAIDALYRARVRPLVHHYW
jgi:aryl-alcohol dehydrogenase-like predicted oxidoreductase